jgi:hypothetical protein
LRAETETKTGEVPDKIKILSCGVYERIGIDRKRAAPSAGDVFTYPNRRFTVRTAWKKKGKNERI